MRAERVERLGAHPRVCGENVRPSPAAAARTGSSPRVRGKRWTSVQRPQGRGLIPACAGKTPLPRPALPRTWAHPRVCGENDPDHHVITFYSGSSPRVRGKHERQRKLRDTHRLIPACAGKTMSSSSFVSPGQAHPRVCGENTMERPEYRVHPGSSPRVRGKRES